MQSALTLCAPLCDDYTQQAIGEFSATGGGVTLEHVTLKATGSTQEVSITLNKRRFRRFPKTPIDGPRRG